MTTSQISRREAAERLLRRREAREDLSTFKSFVWSRYKHPPHLRILDEHLMACALHVESGGQEGISHLIVEMPPRHGKTRTIAGLFPPWFLGRNPDYRVLLSSYGATLAYKSSRYARNVIRTNAYRELFPNVPLSPESAAAEAWNLLGTEGGMDSMGIGGGITGKGGHVIIIDDPIKNREEAESLIYREKVWDSFRDDIYTRREPHAAVIIVMTRWHHDDLVGRLLNEQPDRWTVLNLPAIAEEQDAIGRNPGEALWPERFPLPMLNDIEAQLGSHSWIGLYQQRPTEREGSLFKRAWFKGRVLDDRPKIVRAVRYWDLAGTDESAASDPDYSAGLLLGLTEDGWLVVLDVRHFRLSPARTEVMLKRVASQDGHNVPIHVEQEPGSSGKYAIDVLRRNVLSGYVVEGDRPTGNKIVRADRIAARAEHGDLYVVDDETWDVAEFFGELYSFPYGAHDDQVDALSGAYKVLAGGRITQALGMASVDDW